MGTSTWRLVGSFPFHPRPHTGQFGAIPSAVLVVVCLLVAVVYTRGFVAPAGPSFLSKSASADFSFVDVLVHGLVNQLRSISWLILLFVIYHFQYKTGCKSNLAMVSIWLRRYLPWFQHHFAQLGVHPEGLIHRDSMHCYRFYASGRVGCRGMLCVFRLQPREDLLSMVFGAFWGLPRADFVEIYVPLTEFAHLAILGICDTRGKKAFLARCPGFNQFVHRVTVPQLAPADCGSTQGPTAQVRGKDKRGTKPSGGGDSVPPPGYVAYAQDAAHFRNLLPAALLREIAAQSSGPRILESIVLTSVDSGSGGFLDVDDDVPPGREGEPCLKVVLRYPANLVPGVLPLLQTLSINLTPALLASMDPAMHILFSLLTFLASPTDTAKRIHSAAFAERARIIEHAKQTTILKQARTDPEKVRKQQERLASRFKRGPRVQAPH